MKGKKRLGSGIEELVKKDSGPLKLGLISTKKNGTSSCIQSREIKEIVDRLIGIEQRFAVGAGFETGG